MSDDVTATKPKREISEEHRQKLLTQLQRGRETRARNAIKRQAEKRMVHDRTVEDASSPTPTTAARADPAREDLSRVPEEQLTRRSREERDSGALDVPKRLRKPGWDYEYKSIRCLGQPTDGSEVRVWYDQAWRPVLAREMPELAPPGADLNLPIEAKGCHLYTRPMTETLKARQEDYEVAQRQQQEKAMQAAMGRGDSGIPNQRGLRAVPGEITMEGVAGTGTGRGS